MRKTYSNNKDKFKERTKRFRKEHPEYIKEYRKKYHLKNKEKLNAKSRKYQQDNKLRLNALKRVYNKKNYQRFKKRYWNNKLKFNYGITLEQYNQIFEQQQGRCAICGIEQIKTMKRFAVDHNHITNKVRGLLCNRCNLAIGLFEDSIVGLNKAVEYLKKYNEKIS